MALSKAACAASEDPGMQEVLAAFAANFERLRGKLPGMMQSSLAGLFGPIERQQAEMKEEHQQLRREVSHMHESDTKDDLDLQQQMTEVTEAVRNLTHA